MWGIVTHRFFKYIYVYMEFRAHVVIFFGNVSFALALYITLPIGSMTLTFGAVRSRASVWYW